MFIGILNVLKYEINVTIILRMSLNITVKTTYQFQHVSLKNAEFLKLKDFYTI